jgi:hypothetical protein
MNAVVMGGAAAIGAHPGVDLSSLLQGVTHVFCLAAQLGVWASEDGDFRVYADKNVDPSQQRRVPWREPPQKCEWRDAPDRKAMARANLGVIPGVALEQELGSEYRCLSTVPALP